MSQIITQVVDSCNGKVSRGESAESEWFYVICRSPLRTVRRHVHGIKEVYDMVRGFSVMYPLRSFECEVHTPPSGV